MNIELIFIGLFSSLVEDHASCSCVCVVCGADLCGVTYYKGPDLELHRINHGKHPAGVVYSSQKVHSLFSVCLSL